MAEIAKPDTDYSLEHMMVLMSHLIDSVVRMELAESVTNDEKDALIAEFERVNYITSNGYYDHLTYPEGAEFHYFGDWRVYYLASLTARYNRLLDRLTPN